MKKMVFIIISLLFTSCGIFNVEDPIEGSRFDFGSVDEFGEFSGETFPVSADYKEKNLGIITNNTQFFNVFECLCPINETIEKTASFETTVSVINNTTEKTIILDSELEKDRIFQKVMFYRVEEYSTDEYICFRSWHNGIGKPIVLSAFSKDDQKQHHTAHVFYFPPKGSAFEISRDTRHQFGQDEKEDILTNKLNIRLSKSIISRSDKAQWIYCNEIPQEYSGKTILFKAYDVKEEKFVVKFEREIQFNSADSPLDIFCKVLSNGDYDLVAYIDEEEIYRTPFTMID